MSQNRNILLRKNADSLFQKGEFCFDQKDWKEAVTKFRAVIEETMKIADSQRNKDDYHLLSLCYRDLVWPYYNLDQTCTALECYRESMKYFSLSINGLSSEKLTDSRYANLLASYRPILAAIITPRDDREIPLDTKQAFITTFRAARSFIQSACKKVPLADISKEWFYKLQTHNDDALKNMSVFRPVRHDGINEQMRQERLTGMRR